jgi:3',5'-cyclic AMP phosphodiesterase CpdA
MRSSPTSRRSIPDHIAVTGDLVNIALAAEFAPAAAWLHRLGPPHDVTLVPGNHDAYARATVREALAQWGAYMRGDEAGPGDGFRSCAGAGRSH